MAGKTLIDGVAYNITGGKTLIDGVAYNITGGKTLIDGVAYNIKFGAEPFVIFRLGDTVLQNGTLGRNNGIRFNRTKGIVLEPVYNEDEAMYEAAYVNIGVDFTNYSTLHITCQAEGTTGTRRAGYKTSNNTSIPSSTTTQTIPTVSTELTFDISAVSGTKYVTLYNVNNRVSQLNVYCTSIYFT